MKKANAIIVLGRVDRHGHLTIDAHERIRHAANLFRSGAAPIVVAPAKWWYKLTYDPPCTEAQVIKSRLIEWGVPADAILTEEESCDTLGTALFVKKRFAMPRQWGRIIVVTSLDHHRRTEYVFHKVFGDSIEIEYTWGATVLNDEDFKASVIREAKSLQLMDTTWIGPITPGDHDHVERVLEMHPGYNPTVNMTAEDMERLVQQQALSPS